MTTVMKKRVYVVIGPKGEIHLVRAVSPLRARNNVTKTTHEVRLATHDELIELIGKGVEITEEQGE